MKNRKPVLKREHYKLRGKITFGSYEILTGEKLGRHHENRASLLSPETDIIASWPKGKQFHTPRRFTDDLRKPRGLIMKMGTLKGKQGKQLGFLSLNTDAVGTYWFSCSRGFHNALTQSIASLEILIDEVDPSSGEAETLNAVYRRLNESFQVI